jgi:CubicO group peptidase (beta-lactamase class C family)
MNVRAIGVGLLAVSLLAPAISAAQAPQRATDRRIEEIVNDIRPAVHVRGRIETPITLAADMAAHHVPAVSIAVIDGGRLAWTRAYGLADEADGRRATPDTLFQAASVTKPVTATAALQLVQEGKLGLDLDVNAQLKSWKLPPSPFTVDRPVTLRDLLSHTGGVTVHGFSGYETDARLPNAVQILQGAAPANSPPVGVDHRPGTAWNYSGGGFTIVQLLMTEVSGRPFDEVMQQRVLTPLGMTASTYSQPLPVARRAMAATGYRSDGAAIAGRYHVYPEMAAAGLWTTPSDLTRWVTEIQRAYAGQSSRLLNKAMARAMLTPGLGGWGLGVEVAGSGDTLRFQHGGSNEGFRSSLVGFAKGGRGVVVMTNGDDGGVVADALIRAVSKAYGWKGLEPRTVVAVPMTRSELAAISGRYGPALMTLAPTNDALLLTTNGVQRELVPEGNDRLVALLTGTEFRLIRNAEGRITDLVTPQGKFARAP